MATPCKTLDLGGSKFTVNLTFWASRSHLFAQIRPSLRKKIFWWVGVVVAHRLVEKSLNNILSRIPSQTILLFFVIVRPLQKQTPSIQIFGFRGFYDLSQILPLACYGFDSRVLSVYMNANLMKSELSFVIFIRFSMFVISRFLWGSLIQYWKKMFIFLQSW